MHFGDPNLSRLKNSAVTTVSKSKTFDEDQMTHISEFVC